MSIDIITSMKRRKSKKERIFFEVKNDSMVIGPSGRINSWKDLTIKVILSSIIADKHLKPN
jgi:hypothetical protein